MRLRFGVIAIAAVLVIGACGSSKKGASDGGLGGSNTTVKSATSEACKTATLSAPETGVTDKTITVTVMADVNNPVRPGLFKGSIDAMKAWGQYINSIGGLACRQVVVKTADSKLSADDAKNGITAACGNSLATVGTTALFLQDVSGLESCKDKAGKVTGLPDIAELQTEVKHQCSAVSFATLPTGSACPYSGTGPRTFRVGYTQYDYYFSKYGKDTLHGVFAIPKDLPSTISASMPIFRAENRMGIKSDAEFGVSGLATQPDYTQVVQAMKSARSTYGRNGLDYKGTVLMRKEAAAQGVDTVKVWDCSVQCYDKRLISEGGIAVDQQYVWLNILPMEDGADANPELAAFLKYDKQPDGFGLQAWVAGEIFARAINDTVKANNNDPNSITRANLLTALGNLHDFDAGGLVPKIDVGAKRGSTCLVGMQVQNNKFVRVDPPEKGKFDCDNDKSPLEFSIDPVKEYKG